MQAVYRCRVCGIHWSMTGPHSDVDPDDGLGRRRPVRS
jgi:hypothetical protein